VGDIIVQGAMAVVRVDVCGLCERSHNGSPASVVCVVSVAEVFAVEPCLSEQLLGELRLLGCAAAEFVD
jgi:hypothetical protein